MADNAAIPKSVSEDTISIAGVPLKCFVLDNGMRVIEKGSMDNFCELLFAGKLSLTNDDLNEFRRWYQPNG